TTEATSTVPALGTRRGHLASPAECWFPRHLGAAAAVDRRSQRAAPFASTSERPRPQAHPSTPAELAAIPTFWRLSGAPDQDFGLLEPNLALPRRSAEPKVRGSNPLVRVSEGGPRKPVLRWGSSAPDAGWERGRLLRTFVWRCHSNPRDDRRGPPVSNLGLGGG